MNSNFILNAFLSYGSQQLLSRVVHSAFSDRPLAPDPPKAAAEKPAVTAPSKSRPSADIVIVFYALLIHPKGPIVAEIQHLLSQYCCDSLHVPPLNY
jgi:hypothetical protein